MDNRALVPMWRALPAEVLADPERRAACTELRVIHHLVKVGRPLKK